MVTTQKAGCKPVVLRTDSCIVVSVLISVTGAINIPRTVEAFLPKQNRAVTAASHVCTLSEEELRSLTFQNRENADDDVRMRDGGSRRSRSTSRHDTPPRRGSPESAEEEIPVFDSPTENGPPADVPEPEPHTVRDEEPHGREPQSPNAITASLQEDADRLEKLVKELREREERAQLVGDEDEAANLRVQIANVENLQMALPRPSNAG